MRYVAIGDSFTEGVGDELPGGITRGWADIAAQGWANGTGEAIEYANLAIRGKLVWPIVDEQLEPALALKPTHLSFNGGGNDMLRPKADVARITDAFMHVIRRCDEEGVRLILLSGANPSGQLPFGRVMLKRGDILSHAVNERIKGRDGIITALNWFDTELGTPPFWSPDRLHMNSRGHHRVASRVLDALEVPRPEEWWSLEEITDVERIQGAKYYRQHVAPWLKRRLTGTSSGDGRAPKYGEWMRLEPVTT